MPYGNRGLLHAYCILPPFSPPILPISLYPSCPSSLALGVEDEGGGRYVGRG